MTQDTRERLIEAALLVFAEKGFDMAGVREICETAGTNVASVRYHFADKAGLYRETLRAAQVETFKARTMPETSEDAEADLLSWITWFLATIHSVRGQPFGLLMMREMLNPTDALDFMAEMGARPIHGHLTRLIERILGPQAARPPECPPATELAICVIGMCMHRMKAYPMISRILDAPGDPNAPAHEDIARLARLIATFCLLGLRPREAVPFHADTRHAPSGG